MGYRILSHGKGNRETVFFCNNCWCKFSATSDMIESYPDDEKRCICPECSETTKLLNVPVSIEATARTADYIETARTRLFENTDKDRASVVMKLTFHRDSPIIDGADVMRLIKGGEAIEFPSVIQFGTDGTFTFKFEED